MTLEDTEDPKVGDLGDELRNYEHLQHLYLKGNDIRSIESIAHLYHLLTVNCNTNSVASIKFLEELSGDNTRLQFLQRLDLGSNIIEELGPIPQPRLSWVNLGSNRIRSCADFTGHDSLLTLLLNDNKLVDCSGLAAMPKLVEINLNGNRLTSLTALRGLGSLKKLECARNQLTGLSAFPELPELEHFDASENKIEADGEKEIANLSDCSNLKMLIMSGNPWVDEKGDEFKKEVLIALDMLHIKRVNDMEEDFTEEERNDAKTEKAEREKARLEAEEEARRAAEEAANAPPAEGEEENE